MGGRDRKGDQRAEGGGCQCKFQCFHQKFLHLLKISVSARGLSQLKAASILGEASVKCIDLRQDGGSFVEIFSLQVRLLAFHARSHCNVQ
jgi:hypothetical protein